MLLTELYDVVGPCVIGFISKTQVLPAGQQPVFPEIFGTGFLVNDSGLVATNRHVVGVFDQVGRHPQTGEFAGAALMFMVEADKHGCQMPQTHIGRFALVSLLCCAVHRDAPVYFKRGLFASLFKAACEAGNRLTEAQKA